MIISPSSNLNSYYSYLLKCDGSTFNTTTYATLSQRLGGVNYLPDYYK